METEENRLVIRDRHDLNCGLTLIELFSLVVYASRGGSCGSRDCVKEAKEIIKNIKELKDDSY